MSSRRIWAAAAIACAIVALALAIAAAANHFPQGLTVLASPAPQDGISR